MNKALLVLAASTLSVTPFFTAAQPVEYNGFRYQLTSAPTTWSLAEAEAVALGGHLTDVLSAAEHAFLTFSFLSGANQTRALWIGLSDSLVEGQFRWTTGAPVSFNVWVPGEPNDNNGNEDYVAMNWHTSAGVPAVYSWWNDIDESVPYYGIIKTPVPEPKSVALLLAGVVLVYGHFKRKRVDA